MLASWIDALARRTASTPRSRRAVVLLGASAALLGRLGPAPAAGQQATGCFLAGRRCRHDGQCCSQRCRQGACAACPKRRQQCGHACVDLKRDARHCGRCGQTCKRTKRCCKGRCRECCRHTDCSAIEVCRLHACVAVCGPDACSDDPGTDCVPRIDRVPVCAGPIGYRLCDAPCEAMEDCPPPQDPMADLCLYTNGRCEHDFVCSFLS